MIYCQKCGAENHEKASFCTRCGAQLEFNKPDSSVQQETPQVLKQNVSNDNHLHNNNTEWGQQEPMPVTYLWQAIVCTVVCCAPLGIPAIIYAAKVEKLYLTGDIDEAKRASRNAKNFCIWALVGGIVFGVLYALLMIVGVVGDLSGF